MSAPLLYMQNTVKDKQNDPLDPLIEINKQIEATIKEYHAFTKQHEELLKSLSLNSMVASKSDSIYQMRAKRIADNEKELKDLAAQMHAVKAQFPTVDQKIDLKADDSTLAVEKVKYENFVFKCALLKKDIDHNQKENAAVDNLIAKQEAARPLAQKAKEIQAKLGQLRKDAMALRQKLKDTPEAQTELGKQIMKFR